MSLCGASFAGPAMAPTVPDVDAERLGQLERKAFGAELDLASRELLRLPLHVLERGVGVRRVVMEHGDAPRPGFAHERDEVAQGTVPPADAGGVLVVGVLRVV